MLKLTQVVTDPYTERGHMLAVWQEAFGADTLIEQRVKVQVQGPVTFLTCHLLAEG